MKDYNKRIASLKTRRTDNSLQKSFLSDSFNKYDYGEGLKYVLESMQPVNPSYTRNTYEACERIQNNIKPILNENNYNIEFRYQGSVPINTHIKLYSDIDQLVITNKYHALERPQEPLYPYTGHPIDDLNNIRSIIVSSIKKSFPAVVIDDSGSKAINVSGGLLNRKIDIIPANWFNSNKYKDTNDSDYRGIEILDKNKNERILNYPFMFIYWINYKDDQVSGNLKRLIRFLKTLKADFNDENINQIKISNYDLSSLVFRMEDKELNVSRMNYLSLLINCHNYFNEVISYPDFRNSLLTPYNVRKIFCAEGASLVDLITLNNELKEIIDDVNTSVKPLYENIQKSFYEY
jgi:hypothetical protein